MIRDERQYRITQERVDQFRIALASLKANPPPTHTDPRLQQAGLDAMEAQLNALERELREYEARTRDERP